MSQEEVSARVTLGSLERRAPARTVPVRPARSAVGRGRVDAVVEVAGATRALLETVAARAAVGAAD